MSGEVRSGTITTAEILKTQDDGSTVYSFSLSDAPARVLTVTIPAGVNETVTVGRTAYAELHEDERWANHCAQLMLDVELSE